jgi:TonB family protein
MKSCQYLLVIAMITLAASTCLAQDTSQSASPSTNANPMSLTDADSLTVLLGDPVQWVDPKYPKDALKQRVQGAVVLTLVVAKDGEVKNVTAVSGAPDFTEAAIRAVRKWKYVPYFRNDNPIEAQTTVTINFEITDKGKPDI